jgi:hypothetical protein
MIPLIVGVAPSEIALEVKLRKRFEVKNANNIVYQVIISFLDIKSVSQHLPCGIIYFTE